MATIFRLMSDYLSGFVDDNHRIMENGKMEKGKAQEWQYHYVIIFRQNFFDVWIYELQLKRPRII